MRGGMKTDGLFTPITKFENLNVSRDTCHGIKDSEVPERRSNVKSSR
jgi:hypothetical protein